VRAKDVKGRRELLDFRGDLLLDATLEKTTTGWKAVAAKLAQPLFRRSGGGSKLPIKSPDRATSPNSDWTLAASSASTEAGPAIALERVTSLAARSGRRHHPPNRREALLASRLVLPSSWS
jgi:hypothetical protein